MKTCWINLQRQHVRMTCKEPSLVTLFQLAYNIGQFQGKHCQERMTSVNYTDLKLDQLSTYVSEEDIKKWPDLPEDLVVCILQIFCEDYLSI